MDRAHRLGEPISRPTAQTILHAQLIIGAFLDEMLRGSSNDPTISARVEYFASHRQRYTHSRGDIMNRRHALKALAGLALCPLCASTGFAAEGAHWSYEGATGPDHWGDVDAASKVCSAGSQQSPVDIRGAIKSQLPPLQIALSKKADTIVNNGHTIQLNFEQGSTLKVGSDSYTLLQYHFHHPSEHLIGGKNFPMEVHFVHRNAAGGLAVVGALMTAGKPNAAFSKIVATMPAHEGAPVNAAAGIDPNKLLPALRGYYRYSGSLTTPPCSEVVDWLLLREPIQVAKTDIDSFAKLYPMNTRPAQKDNRRFVLSS
jgi:carbonic anhydrase